MDWATAVWRTDGSAFPTFDSFLHHFREVFEHPAEGRGAGEQLLALSQGRRTAANYALSFRTLAAQTTWVKDTLKLLFRKGLNAELQSELACRDEGRTRSQFIELTIHIDNLIRSRRTVRSAPRSPPRLRNQSPAWHHSTQGKDFPSVTTRIRIHEDLHTEGISQGVHQTVHLSCIRRVFLREKERWGPKTMQ